MTPFFFLTGASPAGASSSGFDGIVPLGSYALDLRYSPAGSGGGGATGFDGALPFGNYALDLHFSPVGATPTPTPTGQGGAGSGADSQVDWRWYEGQELRPNWYEYPQEVKRLRAQIARAKKRKKKLERSLSFARGADDLQQRLDAVAKLEERLQRLLALWRVAEQEADEFMELITEIL